MTKAKLAIALLGAVLTYCSSARADAQSPVRDFPYPFSHMITVASDPDQQTPQRGVAIHRVINDEVGLPIADSMWVKADNPRLSGLFVSDRSLNRTPSGVGHLPNFAVLLREWHRGNIDMINGWQNETSAPLRSTFEPPLTLGRTPLIIKIDKTSSTGPVGKLRHLRLFFDERAPADLSLVAVDAEGHKASADYAALQAGRDVQLKIPKSKATIIEVVFDQAVTTQIFGIRVDNGFDLTQLSELTLTAPSCQKTGCGVRVLGVERDDFSRATVIAELPWLEAWNIRPAVSTSNSRPPQPQNMSGETGRAAAMSVSAVGKMPAKQNGHDFPSDPYRQGYIVDLLQKIGVQFLSTDDNGLKGPPDESVSAVPFNGFSRTRLAAIPTDKVAFGDFLRHLSPSFDARFIDDVYCRHCGAADGAMLALPLDVEMKRAEAGTRVDAILATKFSTGDDDWRPTTSRPLKRSVVLALRSLANLYYGFDGRVPINQRVWVPPASTAARYRQLVASVRDHIAVDGNTITITPWHDDVTGRMIPDLASGTRDLNGLTVYLPDPGAARVLIGGTEIKSFTVNPADETGKPSITIIDDDNPTTILGRTPIGRLGVVTTQNAVFDDVAWPRTDATSHATGTATLKVGSGDGWITVHPRDLTLDNTTWIRLRYRREAKASHGALFVELTMADGGRVMLSEGTGVLPPDSAGSGWWIPHVPGDPGIVTRILPTYGLLWAPSNKAKVTASRPPLPLGRVTAIRIGLSGATKDETVELLELSALRPSGNAVSGDGRLVLGGQVTDGGEPKSGISVTAVVASGEVIRTVTDDNGLYFFPHLAKSEPVYILANSEDGKACAPTRTAVADMQRNTVDLDIDFARCEKPADVATTYLANTR